MNIPTFASEASIYRTLVQYHTATYGSIFGPPPSAGGRTSVGGLMSCGGLGQACCQPPLSMPAVPIVACNIGLGCDIVSGTCGQPCGGSGQPCCDGPETRATQWTVRNGVVYLYSPDRPGLREMCDTGACNASSHRCFSCGTTAGSPCCPPDAAWGVARCSAHYLQCQLDPGTYDSGVCIECGTKGKPPCGEWGCDPGLGVRNGLCDVCGDDGQPPCDDGCVPGITDCGSYCANVMMNGQNCGRCGDVCPPNTTCVNGSCVCPNGIPLGTNLNCKSCGDCTAGQTCCVGSGCKSLRTDKQNCGYCGFACTGLRTCVGGGCLCPAGLTECGPSRPCANLMTDAQNCGWCGHLCPSGQYCSGGACVGGNGTPDCVSAGQPCSASVQCCSGGCGVFHGTPHTCTDCARLHGDCSSSQECCLDAGFCRWTINGPRCEETVAACQDTGTICRFLTPGGGQLEVCCVGERGNTRCPSSNVCP